MLGINLKHTFATAAVAAGLLAPTASASAGTHQAGLVSAGVTDGTSNTIAFGARATTPAGFSIAADGRGADSTPNVDLAGPFVPNN